MSRNPRGIVGTQTTPASYSYAPPPSLRPAPCPPPRPFPPPFPPPPPPPPQTINIITNGGADPNQAAIDSQQTTQISGLQKDLMIISSMLEAAVISAVQLGIEPGQAYPGVSGAIDQATISTLSGMIDGIIQSMNTLATREELSGFLTQDDLLGYATTSSVVELYDTLQEQVNEKVTSGDVVTIVNEVVKDPDYDELNPLIEPIGDFVENLDEI